MTTPHEVMYYANICKFTGTALNYTHLLIINSNAGTSVTFNDKAFIIIVRDT